MSQNFNSPRNNTSPRMYSPRNYASQDFYSPRNNTSNRMYSPNTFQGMYSPNTFQGMYSPHNSPYSNHSPINYSPGNASQGMPSHRSSMPMRQQLFRKSFNESRNSSDFNSSNQSFSSTDSFSPRGRPFNKRKKGGKPYNIQDYINPSMLEDPWADFKHEKQSKMSHGGKS